MSSSILLVVIFLVVWVVFAITIMLLNVADDKIHHDDNF